MPDIFSICFNSLHLPYVSEDEAVWKGISEHSRELINCLHTGLSCRMSASPMVDNTAAQLNGSIFGLCIPEGYVLLKCVPNAALRQIALHGFLIRHDESFRTAWMMTRWQLLFLCSDGWTAHGKVWLTIKEVIDKADLVKLPAQIQGRIVEQCKKMLQVEVPFNFALTDYLKSRLPLMFTEGIDVKASDAGCADMDSIVIDEGLVHEKRCRLGLEFPDIKMYLVRCSSKSFIGYKTGEARSTKEKNTWKSEYKDLPKTANYVWCVRVFKGEKSFTENIATFIAQHLDNGSIKYNDLIFVMRNTGQTAAKFFASASKVSDNVDSNSRTIDKFFKKNKSDRGQR